MTRSYTARTPAVGSLAGMMNAMALYELRDQQLVDLASTTYLGE
jgi:hypothetical protein